MTPVTIGILHSLTGTMASSERPLVDAALLAVDEINAKGGLLGRPLQSLVADGASDPRTFARKAQILLKAKNVSALFGCWTSASRKSVLPVLEATDALLSYPIQYEGLEQNPHVLYNGSCLNQQIEPAVHWSLSQGWRRYLLLGSDYVYPHTANLLIGSLLRTLGGLVMKDIYVPLGSQDFATILRTIRDLQPDAILNTLNGDSNLAFFRQLKAAGFDAATQPVVSFSISEVEQQQMAVEAAGHHACCGYFQSLNTVENTNFIARYQARFGADRVTCDSIVTAYSQIHLWHRAVESAGSTTRVDVLRHLPGIVFDGPGGRIQILPNHHQARPALIGRARPDGQFDIVWRSDGPIAPKPWLGVEDMQIGSQEVVREAMLQFPQAVHHAAQLEAEIRQRIAAETALLEYKEHLEELIAERTVDLIRAKNAAEAASLAKSTFLANMSHEIRTPLSGILGMAHLILRAGLTPAQTRHMDSLKTSAERLLNLLNTILEFSSLETRDFTPEETRVLPDSLAASIATRLHSVAQDKQLEIRTEIGALPATLLGDAVRVERAWLNYADNAVKYTQHGSIVLRANLIEEDAASALIRFEVQDTGIGIAPEFMPKLFSAFEQADASFTRQYDGTGLGLAITRKIAQFLGGDAGAESNPGVGSTFWFTARFGKGVEH